MGGSATIGGFLTSLAADPAATPEMRDLLRSMPGLGALSALWGEDPLHPNAPGDPASLAKALFPVGTTEIPLPKAPEGPEPLMQALRVYAQTQSIPLPDSPVLRTAIRLLELTPEAERALAQLLLAYCLSVDLERAALSGLTADDWEFLQGTSASRERWFGADPGRTSDDYERAVIRLAQERINLTLSLQAAHLLLRAVDATRDAIAAPARASETSSEDLQAAADTEGDTIELPSLLESLDDPNGSPWSLVEALVVSVLPTADAERIALDPRTTLEAALTRLGDAYGLPMSTPEVGVGPLPSSLEHAIAVLVAAQAQGVEARDSAVQAQSLLEALQWAEPTLRAWAALLRVGQDGWAHMPALGSVSTNLLSSSPDPTALVAQGLQLPVTAPQSSPGLVSELTARGLGRDDAVQIANALGPRLSGSLAKILAADAAVEAAYDEALGALSPEQRFALMAAPDVQRILAEPMWTPEEAALIRYWAEALKILGGDALDRVRAAQGEALATIQSAVAGLSQPHPASHDDGPALPTPPLPVPAPSVSLPPVPTVPVPTVPNLPPLPTDCTTVPGFTDCSRDVWLRTPQAGGILITGSRASTIDLALAGGDPRITIDLGGDDVYLTSAGSGLGGFLPAYSVLGWIQASGTDGLGARSIGILANATPSRPFAVTIDLSGNDKYDSPQDIAEGSAAGYGAMGMLWDVVGNDRYQHQPPSSTSIARGAQGLGVLGGLGILVDSVGADTYAAPTTSGQGAGINPMHDLIDTLGAADLEENPITPMLGGAGFLFDLGLEADSFLAKAGQGHGRGEGSLGMLVDQAGNTHYLTTQAGRVEFQGGASGRFAYGLLADLGGSDSYSNSRLDAAAKVKPDQEDGAAKGNDRIWVQDTSPAPLGGAESRPWNQGVGIDLSAGDDDGDLYPNLVEMAAGSDPQDHFDTPSATEAVTSTVAEIQATVEGALKAIQEFDASDPDEDGFPTSLETLMGSDPQNESSTPVSPSNDILFQQRQCYNPIDGVLEPPADGSNCIALLTVGGTGSSTFNVSALVSIDLGGPDTYTATVAGTSLVAADGTWSFGEFALDLDGNDTYDNAQLDGTQGSALRGGASILIDLAGNDRYLARSASQGSGAGPDAGVGFLIDLQGDDEYRASTASQGFATQGSSGALIDLGGKDRYTSDTQGFGRERSLEADERDLSPVGAQPPGIALLYDASGVDRYTSVSADARLRYDPSQPTSVFAPQGNALSDDGYQGSAYFLDNGNDLDSYFLTGSTGGLVDVSPLKNEIMDLGGTGSQEAGSATTPQARMVAAVRVFADNPGALSSDPDGDGTPTYFELLSGSRPNDPQDNPGAAGRLANVLAGAGSPAAALDRPEDWLRFEPAGSAGESLLSPGELGLPGLVIGGRGNSIHNRPVVFLVDLGGDDRYQQPFAGGMSPNLHSHYRGDRELAGGRFTAGAFVGAFAPLAVSLLLDVSPDTSASGDDVYAPDPGPCNIDEERTDQDLTTYNGEVRSAPNAGFLDTGGAHQSGIQPMPPLAVCPSLGGAFAGIGILADDGGVNHFESSMKMNFVARSEAATARASALAYGVSQGAGYLGGVGALVTWNATNTFDAQVEVQAREVRAGASAIAVARGVTQGAGWGGVGILAALGGGDDAYTSKTTASVPADNAAQQTQAAEIAQGSTQDGFGILFDTGGSNRYTARRGFAQGYAGSAMDEFGTGTSQSKTKPVGSAILDTSASTLQTSVDTAAPFLGLLWSGNGDDEYVGEAFSQGSSAGTWGPVLSYAAAAASQASIALGVLLEGGGSDQYKIGGAPPDLSRLQCPILVASYARAPACAVSQGSAAQNGVGILVDLSGDDQYIAPTRTSVQGASHLAYAALLDLSGNDVYRADSHALGYATVDTLATAAAHLGLMADLGGNDYYEAKEFALGSGQTRPGVTAGPVGVFVDGGGVDVYKTTVEAANGAQWLGGTGAGLDAAFEEQALVFLQSTIGPTPDLLGLLDVFVTTDADDFLGDDAVQADEVVSGPLYLVATYHPGKGIRRESVRRVSFALNGRTLGPGAFVEAASASGDVAVFQLPWMTDARDGDASEFPMFPDGDYQVSATAFLDHAAPPPDAPWAPATTPDSAPYTVSMDWAVQIDNPPVVILTLSGDKIAPPASTVTLDVKVEGDYPHAGLPTAVVDVNLRPTTNPSTIARHYGPFEVLQDRASIVIDGMCGTVPCDDGRYLVNVEARDSSGQEPLCASAVPSCMDRFEVILDSTAPTSTLLLGAFANVTLKRGVDAVAIPWSATDDPRDLGASNVAGVRDVTVLQLDALGGVLANLGTHPPSDDFVEVSGASEGKVMRFITVATDELGWRESPCLAGEPEPCFRAKLARGEALQTTIDFVHPSLTACHTLPDDSESCDPAPRVIRPGPVAFHVNGTDPGAEAGTASGLPLDGVRMEIQDVRYTMTNVGGSHFVFADWENEHLAADEHQYTYRIVARDAAGNEEARTFALYLDELAPRIGTPHASFRVGNKEFPEPKPGSVATFQFRVDDVPGGTVTAWLDGTDLQGPSHLDCSLDPNAPEPVFWLCAIAIPTSIEERDEPYEVVLHVEDQAGNVAARNVPLELAFTPPEIFDVTITGIGYSNLTVRWKTASPTTGQVLFGITSQLGRLSSRVDEFQTEHEIEVRGLAPSTRYFIAVQSVSRAGLANVSVPSPVLTTSAYRLAFVGFPQPGNLSGLRSVGLRLESLTAVALPVRVTVRVQDSAGRTSPVLLDAFSLMNGPASFAFNTTGLPDGSYVLLLDAVRLGDQQALRSPVFRIDNAVPAVLPKKPVNGSVINESQPLLRFEVSDFGAPNPPAVSTLRLTVDGRRANATVSKVTPILNRTDAAAIELHVDEDLGEGPHVLRVSLEDAAGNVGLLNLSLAVDLSPPAVTQPLQLVLAKGQTKARPDGSVNLSLGLEDATGIAAAWVDLRSVGGAESALVALSEGLWGASVKIPSSVGGGTKLLPVFAVDKAGNRILAATANLTVDAVPPRMSQFEVQSTGFTSGFLHVLVDEPARLAVRLNGTEVFVSDIARQEQRVDLRSLRPSTSYLVEATATDLGGNVDATVAVLRMPIDDSPASPVLALAASSLREGVVKVSWEPAQDNAGIDHYVVERLGRVGVAWTARAPQNQTQVIDRDAPPGRNVTYRVRAVDLAANMGLEEEASTVVAASPHLISSEVEPRAGPASKPFTFRVTYLHAADRRAESVIVRVDGQDNPMRPTDADCTNRCVYEATLHMEPTILGDEHRSITFLAESAGENATLELKEVPLVLGEVGGSASSVPPLGLMVGLVAVAALRRRRRMP